LLELRQAHPDLDVQLVGSNHVLNLPQREADIAIRNVKPTHKSLAARRLVELGGCVYASKLYLERRGHPRSPDALEDTTSWSTRHSAACRVSSGCGSQPEAAASPFAPTTPKLAYALDGPAGPFASAASRWATRRLNDRSTLVTVEGNFTPRNALARFIVWPLAKPMIRRLTGRVLTELEAFLTAQQPSAATSAGGVGGRP
jgi:DNA-binding transcriptional LysR family regulator